MIFSKEYLIDFLNNRYKKLKESQTDEDKRILNYFTRASHGESLTKEEWEETNEYYYKKSKEERENIDIKPVERTSSEEKLRLIFSLSYRQKIKEFKKRHKKRVGWFSRHRHLAPDRHFYHSTTHEGTFRFPTSLIHYTLLSEEYPRKLHLKIS